MEQEKINKQIIKRLERLEKAVFGGGVHIKKVSPKKYSGPKGGIQLLIDKSLFPKKLTASEAKKLLEKYDYHYRRQVVQTALNRLSKPGGPLVSFKEGGKKVYAKRK